ncbi:OLC1v1009964C1 [Oldenlandia corymbosa var. corymbosa]|uniref:OLC1v1009964C1 n=1 Tax=Oldenlandia corymbosa var. corymbosa TaxID=529605 RepID=A0AAV1DQ57_OLDCO|nr:OLC1v1009964C1 [Oldenlandia corymbosa var. corymbosa]
MAVAASDVQLLLVSLLTTFLFLYLTKLYLRRSNSSKADESQLKLPPGNTGWPFLGETLDFYSKAQKGVLENFVIERSQKYSSKIFKTSLIGQPIAVVYGAEGNKFLFSNEKKLLKHWWPSAIDKLFPNSDRKTNADRGQIMRRFIASILKGEALREYVKTFDMTIKQQLQTHWNSQQVFISEMARKYTFASACRIFLGVVDPVKADELEEGIKIIAIGLHSAPIDLPGTALNRGIKASKKIRKELEEVIRQKKIDLVHSANDQEKKTSTTSEKDFILHMLLSTDDNGQPINEVDMASHLTGVLQAAYASVHSTITNLMKYLAEFPEVYNVVLEEQQEIAKSKGSKDRLCWEDVRKMKHSWHVVSEVLRLLPPGVGGFKETIADLNYEGYKIPKGWKIHWNSYATHKNPEYFPNPEKFDPSRFQGDGPTSYTYVPFGGGTRMCPGNDYARIAILIFLHNVAMKFKWEKSNPNEDLVHDPLPRPAQGLPVYLHPI